jgi:hypothetical protein
VPVTAVQHDEGHGGHPGGAGEHAHEDPGIEEHHHGRGLAEQPFDGVHDAAGLAVEPLLEPVDGGVAVVVAEQVEERVGQQAPHRRHDDERHVVHPVGHEHHPAKPRLHGDQEQRVTALGVDQRGVDGVAHPADDDEHDDWRHQEREGAAAGPGPGSGRQGPDSTLAPCKD